MKHLESQHQQALFRWVQYNMSQFPELALMYHIPNGGKRDAREAARLKSEGVKAGVPDICFPVPRNGHPGMYIEMKAEKGRLTENQKWWIDNLENHGYRVAVCYSWEEAQKEIMRYLKEE